MITYLVKLTVVIALMPFLGLAQPESAFFELTSDDPDLAQHLEQVRKLVAKKTSVQLHVSPAAGRDRAPESDPQPLSYQAKDLPQTDAPESLTLGDHRLRQIFGRECPIIPVWPNTSADTKPETVTHRSRGGNALNITQVSHPTLTVVHPPESKTNGRAVIVCPGGGYGGLAAEHEGTVICEWLSAQGITSILLKYRVPKVKGQPKHAMAVADLQRSLRLVRANAKAWGLDPAKIGILGFSAGGHACATLSANPAKPFYEAVDATDKLSSRPDFTLLIYPAYLVEKEKLDPLFSDLSNCPPLFTTVAANDRFADGLLTFFGTARAAKIPAELHLYPGGGHGGGIDPISYPASEWVVEAARWLGALE